MEKLRRNSGLFFLWAVAVGLWREFVFPDLGRAWALSYQDAVIHGGDLYRFDGWVRLAYSRSGTDKRSGRKGRNKWLWGWHPDAHLRAGRAVNPATPEPVAAFDNPVTGLAGL